LAFRVPTRVEMRSGCAADAGRVCAELGGRRALLAHDAGLAGSPGLESVAASLADAGLSCERTSDIESNPRISTVERIAELVRASGCDVVVGMGGGSALDAAKAAAMLATNAGPLESYVGRNRYPAPPLPFVAVPTTCGTGSEVTWVSVITDPREGVKLSVKGETMFPAWALVDADLLRTLPAQVVAWTALDALTHALEARTCRFANPVSDALAERAAALVFEHLRAGWTDIGGDAAAREGLMQAATLAGLAFGNADVAGVHCLSETLGGRFDVPHGMANAMLLAPVLRHHLPVVAPKLAPIAGAAGGTPDGDELSRAESVLAAVERLVRDVGIPPFSSLGIEPRHFPWIAQRAAENNSNPANPRPMSAGDYVRILESVA